MYVKIISNSFSGDIIVFNTNLWNHSTNILEGLSISIGGEFAVPNASPIEKRFTITKKVPPRSISKLFETIYLK